MGKIKKRNKQDANYNAGIAELNISDACTEYMKIFGANNNIMRHLSGIYDGLRLGERRIIYTMYLMGIDYKSHFKKVASITGRVLDFHPHGEVSSYETLVKLAQPWNNIQCLVQGSGNFGNPAGDPAGASRYIEARLTYYAYKCFLEEFSPGVVDMKINYLGDQYEPEYFPAKYPNALINNVFGIGYGMSTSISTYNLKEVLELTLKLMDDPKYPDITLIPDSPTGSYIVDEGQFKEISETGRGKFKMRGVIDIDEEENCLIIRSTPLQAFWNGGIKKDILTLLNDGKVNMLRDITDENDDPNGMCYKLYLKKEIDPVSVMHMIYSKTQMEKTFPVKFKLLEDYEDNDYNVRTILLTWLDFRRETKRRIYNHKLSKATERQHILEILIFILNKDNAEKTIGIIKKSQDKKETISKLMSEYGISSLQADTIAEMKMTAFTKEAYNRYIKEKETIDKQVEKFNKIVRSYKKIDNIIRDELKEGIELFGEERKSKIITVHNELKVRDIPQIIVFTNNGFVKKLPADVNNIGYITPNDYPTEVIECKNTDELLIFDQSGKISKLSVYNVQGTVLSSPGVQLSTHCSINGAIRAIKPKPTAETLSAIPQSVYFLMITKNGIIKKTLANSYINIKNELLGMVIKPDDELVSVKWLVDDKDILVYTDKGMGTRFNSSEIKETSRMSIGVKSIDMDTNEHVLGMDIMNPNDRYVFVLTSHGFGKKCTLNNFGTQPRNVKPLKLITLDENDSVLLARTIKGNETFKVYQKGSIEELDMDDVVELPRLSKGRKLIKVPKGETIINIRESH